MGSRECALREVLRWAIIKRKVIPSVSWNARMSPIAITPPIARRPPHVSSTRPVSTSPKSGLIVTQVNLLVRHLFATNLGFAVEQPFKSMSQIHMMIA